MKFASDDAFHRPIKSLELEFHVPIIRTNVKGRDAKIGNASAEHLIQMQVLKLEGGWRNMVNVGPLLTSSQRPSSSC